MMDFETVQSKERLLSGTATQQDRDRVLYFLAESRWTPEQLDKHIQDVHSKLCDRCPDRMRQAAPRFSFDWNGIIKTILWIFAGLVAVIMTLTKTTAPGA